MGADHATILKYAAQRFFALGIPVSKGTVRGVGIEDLVHDAIVATWTGGRTWDHKTVPLMTFLQNVISSKISNLLDLSDVKAVDSWPSDDEREDESLEDVMLRKHANPGHDHGRYLPGRPRTPEELLSEHEEIESFNDLLLEAAGDDDEIVRYLDALDKGIEKPSLIAKEWKVSRETIYNVENRLRSRLKKVVQETNAQLSHNKNRGKHG